MNDDSIEFFLHGNGKAQVQSGLEDETLKQVLERLNALPQDGEVVFVGESNEAVGSAETEHEEDAHEPADLNSTLGFLRLRELRHVHTRATRRIEVTGYFNGNDHKRKFSPAATIATVLAWAKKRFKLDPKAGADYVLALRPQGTHPRPDEHLGELLKPGSKALEFDLVREVTPQG